jgi:acyl-[acyl-carrier-protein]-phospholipid O-acyltransferase/long-chain-fatty-acid--[acyl-carrier-protein] ligase
MTQFLGAFNDNFFKSAMVMLITYGLADRVGYDPRILVNLAGGVYILPFFLFSALAGQLADRYERASLSRWVKVAEVAVMSLAVVGFYTESVGLLMAVLFLMGAQSAFFGPLKYSILPQHLAPDELVAGNGLVQMGTFLAILTGTIFGGLSVSGGVSVASFFVVFIAAAGWFASRYIPSTTPVNPGMKISFHLIRDTLRVVANVAPRRDVFPAVLSISWFWFVGAAFLSQFPAYAKLVLGADEKVATLFLAVFSVGIGAGSMACDRLLKGEVTTKWVPTAAVTMSAAAFLLFLASLRAPAASGSIGIAEFVSSWRNAAVLACLFAVSFSGGIYIVPLYALIQHRTEERSMAGVIACANVTDSLMMVLSALATSGMLAAGLSIPHIFLATAVMTTFAVPAIKKGCSC